MTNNSKQIYNLIMASKRLTPAFAQALHKHPNAKRFSIVATKSERVFTFVPAHLERFAPSDAKLTSINRPQNLTEKAITKQIHHTCGALFNQMQPSLMFKYKIDELMARSFRFTWFSQVSDLVDRSTALDQDLRDRANDLYIRYVDTFMANTQTFLDKANKQGLDLDDNSPLSNVSYTMSQDGTDVFVSVCNGVELSDPEDVWDWLGITPEQLDSLKQNDFMDMASRRLNGYKAEYEGIDLYRSLADLDITTVCGLPRIALDGEPISKDVIWSWIEKQGLSPDDNFYSKEIEERLKNLALNSQVVAGIACNVANTVIVKYQNDIDALSDLETVLETTENNRIK